MVYPYNGILFSLKKKGNPVTCCNMNEPGGHHAKSDKPVTNKYCMIHMHEVSKVVCS